MKIMAKFNWHLLVVLIFSIHPQPSWSSKINVTIPILAPLMNRDSDRFGYGVASMYAIDLINKRNDILKDYHLVPKIYDTVTRVKATLHIMPQVIGLCKEPFSPPPVIIGPSFSATTIASYNSIALDYILQYTYGSTSPELNSFHQFKYLVRMYPGTTLFSQGHLTILKEFGWKRVGIFFDHHELEGLFNKITNDLIETLKQGGISVVGVESAAAGTGTLSTPDEEIKNRLARLKADDAKIIFAQFTHVRAFRVFCQAYKLGMFGRDYVWIINARTESVKKWLTAIDSNYLKSECGEAEYRKISERMLFFNYKNLREDNMTTFSGLTVQEYSDYMRAHRLHGKHPFDATFHNSTYHSFIFDSLWNMALTLNASLPFLKRFNFTLDRMPSRNVTITDKLLEIAHGIVFEGMTGTVKLDQERGRIGPLGLFQLRDTLPVEVGVYYGIKNKLRLFKDNNFLWIDGQVPSDTSRKKRVIRNVQLPLFLPFCTVAGLGIVLATAVLVFNIYHRKISYIRRSAPLFNNMIIVGVMMCLSTVAFFGFPVELDDTSTFLLMCRLRTWVLCLGFSLGFGSMFVKTWRVYKIFTNRRLKYSIERLSNPSLIAMVVGIVVVDACVLLLWELINPMHVKVNTLMSEVDSNDPNLKLIPVIYSCDSANQDKWITTVYVVKGILLFYGLFLAYETRNVHYEHLNDSRMIGVSVYNCVVMSLLGGISRIVLSLNFYELSYGITVTCIIFPSLGTLFLIFLPKVVRFMKHDHLSENETSDGVVIEGPGARKNHLRNDSVCSEGVTSVTSVNGSIPSSNSRIMPIYEEASQVKTSTKTSSESPA